MLITHIAHKHLNRAVYEKGGDGGASKAQAKAQQQAIDLQREQWNTVMNNLKPYAEVGLPALQQLQGLMTLEGQNKAANDFFGSGLYKTQADQARYQNLVSAEATGGLGSTATSNQLSSIAPMLYNNWLSGQMQNYGNLLNVGMNAASGQATAGQNYANNTGQLLQGLGAIRAGQAQQPSSLARGIGGAASGALAGAQLGSVVPGKQAFYAAYPLPSTNEIDRSQSATQNIQHTSSDNSLASGYAKLATQQREGLERSAEQGASLGAAMRDAITGESRMTPEMERLQNVASAPELNSLSMDALKAGWSQLFGSDASQEKILQGMGATLRQDEKGNTIVSLPSGDYALNKPGLSPQDLTSFLANALAFTPAGRAGTVLGAIGKSAATDLALQGATSLAGGEDIDPLQTVISAGIGGIGKGLENTASAVSRAVRGDMSPEAKAAVDFASERNLPLMTSDMLKDKTFMQSQAQTLGERVPFFGT